MRNLALFLLLQLWKGGEDKMATIYVTLIVRGYKTYADVPAVLKPEVKNQLEALELGELAV
ncbi:CD1375 family protein [Paenibacillus chitinolyticus]